MGPLPRAAEIMKLLPTWNVAILTAKRHTVLTTFDNREDGHTVDSLHIVMFGPNCTTNLRTSLDGGSVGLGS